MQRPVGVTAIAIVFFLSAAYLAGLGAAMLIAPGTLSMRLGAPLLFDLVLAGPYMFLLFAAVGALTFSLRARRDKQVENRRARAAAGVLRMLNDEQVKRAVGINPH